VICIPEEQRRLHVTSEALALVIVTPFMFYVSAQRELPPWARATSFGIGVSTALIDGWLLWRYASRSHE
jgi:hypothetical protein